MLFTIPYNNSDPEKFLELFEPYLKNIDSFYLGVPGLFVTHNPYKQPLEKLLRDNQNTYRFLELCRGRIKTILCINTPVYPLDIESCYFKIIKDLTPLVVDYGLQSVNVASPTLADLISVTYPQVEVQTSCNTYMFLARQYLMWNERFRTTVFNLPREALRMPKLLQEVKQLGFKTKCIVNEGCIFGCPANIEHACSFVMPKAAVQLLCDRQDYRLSEVFRSNFIPPHFLNKFEDLLDIVKIAGRGWSSERILKTFLAYLHQDPEADVLTLLHSRAFPVLKENHIQIKASDWPKKTLTCECKECKTCNICEKAMLHAIKRSGVDVNSLTRPI